MADLLTDCASCGSSYNVYAESCPACGTPNPHYGVRSMKGIVKAAVIGIVVVAALAAVVLLAPSLFTLGHQAAVAGDGNSNNGGNPLGRAMTILRPDPAAQAASKLPKEELVRAALDAINKDREGFDLPPVKLSSNSAAQAHAEDMFATKQISHWTTGGKKPYMVYTERGGTGSVHQNVAIAGFGPEEHDRCASFSLICEKIVPAEAIAQLEHEMVYNDKDCCDDGHRDNILDPHHTHVSIGIAYDDYYLALVQNFENNYGLDMTIDQGYVSITGPVPAGARLEDVAVYYDETPKPSNYVDNIKNKSYDVGELVASVLEPLPPGLRYQQPKGGDSTVIEADSWVKDKGTKLDIAFDLQPAIKKPGVYTIYVMLKDAQGRQFDATSYSVFVQSTDAVVGTMPQ